MELKKNYPKFFLTLGVIGIAIALLGLFQGVQNGDPRPIFSWLIGFTVWYAVTLGCLFFLLLFYVFDAGWPIIIRRQIEHVVAFFPYLALIFIPLLAIAWFGDNPGILWPWLNLDNPNPGGHGTIGHDPLYLNKAGLLNREFFTIRILGYFGIFIFVSRFLRKQSFAMDKNPSAGKVNASRVVAAISIPVCALASTFATFDFFMSLSYHWFSTMYGVWFFATAMRAALVTIVIICALLATRGYLKGIFNKYHLYNLGCLFLAFTVFWAYVSFAQYFLIYNANIPEETFWYNMREINADGTKSAWYWLSIFGLIFSYFVIPFLFLLWNKTKITLKRMVLVACWIGTFFIADLYFNILPYRIVEDNVLGYVVQAFSITLWDVAAIIGVGSLFVWSFFRSAKKQEPIPINDPRINESINYHA